MTTIVRRRALGIKSVKGIIEHSDSAILKYANNYEGLPHDDVYIRWGCTSHLPNPGAAVINSAEAIHRVANKRSFREVMQEYELCPKTWFYVHDFFQELDDTYPMIVRTQNHAQGRGLWVANNYRELVDAVQKAGPGYYINEFIPKVAEFRVFVHQGRVAWVAEKTPGNPDAVAWNVNKGGRFDNVRWDKWDMQVVNNALAVWELTGLHFSGIDVMVTEEGNTYCLEANSAPSQTSPYRQSCVAKAFDWMQTNDNYKRRAFPSTTAMSWKDAIHPAVRGENE